MERSGPQTGRRNSETPGVLYRPQCVPPTPIYGDDSNGISERFD